MDSSHQTFLLIFYKLLPLPNSDEMFYFKITLLNDSQYAPFSNTLRMRLSIEE